MGRRMSEPLVSCPPPYGGSGTGKETGDIVRRLWSGHFVWAATVSVRRSRLASSLLLLGILCLVWLTAVCTDPTCYSPQQPPRVFYRTTRIHVPRQHKYRSLPPYNFSYVHENPGACRCIPNVTLVAFAFTAPQDIEQRQAIRATWGNRTLLAMLGVVLLFPLGVTDSVDIMHKISLENDRYADVVQSEFVDSYKNLSYKAVMMVKWTKANCMHSPFLLKLDIDVFPNMAPLVQLLTSDYANEPRFMLCKVHWRSLVLRPEQWCGKWCVPRTEYRPKYYPPYCWGSVYVISGDLIPDLHSAINSTPIWWVADVYLTGMLPRISKPFKHIVLKGLLEENTDYFLTRLQQYPLGVLFGFIRNNNNVYTSWKALHDGVVASQITKVEVEEEDNMDEDWEEREDEEEQQDDEEEDEEENPDDEDETNDDGDNEDNEDDEATETEDDNPETIT